MTGLIPEVFQALKSKSVIPLRNQGTSQRTATLLLAGTTTYSGLTVMGASMEKMSPCLLKMMVT